MPAEVLKTIAFRELEEKNKKIRLKWFEKYYDVLKAVGGDREAVQITPMMTELMDEIAKMRKQRFMKERDINAKKLAEKEAYKKNQLEEEEIDLEILKRGPMYPVEKEIHDTIYGGISANKEGRWLYLRLRNLKAPYDKYYDPQSMSHEYGWKVEERALPVNKQFARHCVIIPQFYRRTGVKGETLRNRPPATGLFQIEKIQLAYDIISGMCGFHTSWKEKYRITFSFIGSPMLGLFKWGKDDMA